MTFYVSFSIPIKSNKKNSGSIIDRLRTYVRVTNCIFLYIERKTTTPLLFPKSQSTVPLKSKIIYKLTGFTVMFKLLETTYIHTVLDIKTEH